MMSKEMIEYIVNYKTYSEITVCQAEGFIQQLAGKYSKLLLLNIESILVQNIMEERNKDQKKR
ncbi:MAG: hypothetical protein Kow0098_24110 [Ignavibacteriaceae bacterium]